MGPSKHESHMDILLVIYSPHIGNRAISSLRGVTKYVKFSGGGWSVSGWLRVASRELQVNQVGELLFPGYPSVCQTLRLDGIIPASPLLPQVLNEHLASRSEWHNVDQGIILAG